MRGSCAHLPASAWGRAKSAREHRVLSVVDGAGPASLACTAGPTLRASNYILEARRDAPPQPAALQALQGVMMGGVAHGMLSVRQARRACRAATLCLVASLHQRAGHHHCIALQWGGAL